MKLVLVFFNDPELLTIRIFSDGLEFPVSASQLSGAHSWNDITGNGDWNNTLVLSDFDETKGSWATQALFKMFIVVDPHFTVHHSPHGSSTRR
jgi:hypothetical protein